MLTALEQTWDGLFREMAAVTEGEWALPTPCPEWDVHDLIAHIAGTESGFQGFPQPSPPAGFVSGHEGIDHWTAVAVAARRDWTHDAIVDEAMRAGEAQLESLRHLDADGWGAEVTGPLGPTTVSGLAELRAIDLYIHLLDLRAALGRPLRLDAEPVALAAAVDRVISLAGWGAAKKAGLRDDTEIGIELVEPAPRSVDVVVVGGRGHVEANDGERDDVEPVGGSIRGTGAAFLLEVSGREGLVAEAGGVQAHGDVASRFLAGYRLFN